MKRLYVRFPGHGNVFEVTKLEFVKGSWVACLKAGKIIPECDVVNDFSKRYIVYDKGTIINWDLKWKPNYETTSADHCIKLLNFLKDYECDSKGGNLIEIYK